MLTPRKESGTREERGAQVRTIKLTIAATETHCEHNGTLCGFLKFTWPRPRCLAFTEGQEEPKRDMDHAGYKRLPECIAAEEAAK